MWHAMTAELERDILELNAPEDTRLIHLSDQEEEEEEAHKDIHLLDTLVQSGAEESEFTDTEGEQARDTETRQARSRSVSEVKITPR